MTQKDKEITLEIVAKAFYENPRMQTILRKGKTEKRIKYLANYAYNLVKKYNGVYLSKDKSTVLIYYRKSQYKMTLKDYFNYIVMFIKHIRPSQLIPTYKREKYIESLRPDIPDYIYVWVLGSKPDNKSLRGLADIRDHLFGLSEELGIPVVMETTVDKVIKLYEYVGFKLYHTWNDESTGLKVRFFHRGDIGEYGEEEVTDL